MWGAAVFGFPLYAAGASPLFVYNFLFLLGMFLSALAAWALARDVTGDPRSRCRRACLRVRAVAAGADPARPVPVGGFLALLLLFRVALAEMGSRARPLSFRPLLRLERAHRPSLRDLLGHPARGPARVGAIDRRRSGAPKADSRSRRGDGRCRDPRPAVLRTLRAGRETLRMRRSIGEMTFYSALPSALLVAGPQNKLWSPLTQRFARPEAEMFPGARAGRAGRVRDRQLRRSRGESPGPSRSASARPAGGALRAARALDFLALAALAAGVAGLAVPNLRVGPLNLGDPAGHSCS